LIVCRGCCCRCCRRCCCSELVLSRGRHALGEVSGVLKSVKEPDQDGLTSVLGEKWLLLHLRSPVLLL
jgi:hypothetical protein